MLTSPPSRPIDTALLSPAAPRRDVEPSARDARRAPSPRPPEHLPLEYPRLRQAPSETPAPKAFPWDDPALAVSGKPHAPIAANDMPKQPRRLIAATIAISLAVHVGAIAAAMPSEDAEKFGATSEKTEAISLATTQTVVLESIATDTTEAAAAAASSQAGSVQSAEAKPQELSEVKDLPTPDEPPPKPIKVADVTPTAITPADEPLPVIRGGAAPDEVGDVKAVEQAAKAVEEMPDAVETKDDAPEKIEREKQLKKEREATEQQESHQQTAGSATSRASTAAAAVNGRVSASNGNALSYAARVRAQVARNKPTGNGRPGTARVSFGIDRSGALSYVRLAESCGIADLDSAALSAVRQSAPFGEPPDDVALNQLMFVIPFYFH